MSTTPSIQKGDLVVLKSGSPNMVVLKVPSDLNGKVTVMYWGMPNGANKEIQVPMAAIETPEEHFRRVQKLEELHLSMKGTAVLLNEALLVIQFSSAEDKERFLKEKFENGSEDLGAKLH